MARTKRSDDLIITKQLDVKNKLSIGGVEVLATAAELNALDGITASPAELNLIDGSIAGTAVASKAAVLGVDKNLDTLAVADGGLKLGAGAGTAVTATAAELNLIDGSVAGTAVASKAAALGANKNLDTLAIADGGLKLGAGAGTAVTATAPELNETMLTLEIADGSAEATYHLVCPHAGAISKIYSVIDAAVADADIVITANIGATPLTNGALTIATAASAAGDVDSATPTAANVVTAGQAVNFVVSGGGAGGTPRVRLSVVLTR